MSSYPLPISFQVLTVSSRVQIQYFGVCCQRQTEKDQKSELSASSCIWCSINRQASLQDRATSLKSNAAGLLSVTWREWDRRVRELDFANGDPDEIDRKWQMILFSMVERCLHSLSGHHREQNHLIHINLPAICHLSTTYARILRLSLLCTTIFWLSCFCQHGIGQHGECHRRARRIRRVKSQEG